MFTYFLDTTYGDTMWLYFAIFVFSSIFAFMSQKRRRDGKFHFKVAPFFLSFAILWFFYALNDVGADTSQYRYLYEDIESEYAWGVLEPGYHYLNKFFYYNITNNSLAGIACIRTLQLFLVFVSFYLLRNKTSVGFAVMAYVAIVYFQSYNILRISLALSGCMISYALMSKGKKCSSIVLAISMIFIHRSAFIFAAVIVAYYFCNENKLTKRISALKYAIGLSVILLPLIGAYLMRSILELSIFSDRYDNYVSEETSIGIMVFIYYIPLFFLLYHVRNASWCKGDYKWYYLNAFFALTGFAVAVMGYGMGMLTRANIYFIMPFTFYIGYCGQKLNYKPRVAQQYILFFIVYWVFRFIVNTNGIIKPSSIYDYKMII